MKRVLIIHSGTDSGRRTITFRDQSITIDRAGCQGDMDKAAQLIRANDGKAAAIALECIPTQLALGGERHPHEQGAALLDIASQSPVVDGRVIRSGLERWAVILADRAQPGIFAEKRILMFPGLNHTGLAQALTRHTAAIRYADPMLFFGLPSLPGMGSRLTVEHVAERTLDWLKDAPLERLCPLPGQDGGVHRLATDVIKWADILAGDIGAIRTGTPYRLKRKTVVVDRAGDADVKDLQERGVSTLITLMPSLDGGDGPGNWSAAAIEAVMVALLPDPALPLSEDTFLDLMAGLEWTPDIRVLQPDEAGINRFAFVIHPLSIDFIHRDPRFRWTRNLPDEVVESVSAYMPPLYMSKVTGGKSPTTGQRIEGHLISLGATPRQMLKHGERFTYNRLNQAARMAERLGARIMGLGAFTSVVGDAGITVAHESDIAITSGNSLTVAATLEAAKQAVIRMGATDLTKGKVMVVGATGSIGSVCSRLLAQAIHDVVLVSIEPERLIDLKRTILKETPGATVTIATHADDHLGDCELVVTTTSAFGQRVIDITKCKPGAVICDVARPPDINPREAALRPDVLVIESGEVRIPGDIDFGYDIGLPPKTAYACLAETALLAMEGRFEDYTLGRNITMKRVKEIYRLFKKHKFEIADLRSFGKVVSEDQFAEKRAIAERLRKDPALFAEIRETGAEALKHIPVMAKGVQARRGMSPAAKVGLAAVAAGAVWWLLRNGRRD